MSEDAKSQYLLYVERKGWNYRIVGNQINVDVCPLPDCGCSGFKFFMNIATGTWDCKRCQTKGNIHTLMASLGDRTEGIASMRDAQQARTAPEKFPDVDAAHERLLADDEVLNYLNDERGWTPEVIKQMKLGVAEKNFGRDGEQDIRKCLIYPYYSKGSLVFCKFRTLPPQKKDFRVSGGRDNPLYNGDAITPGMSELLIVEGEADALSCLSNGISAVVGVPGAEMKKVTWDRQLDLPQKMYLLFDRDKAGQDGAYNFAIRFGIERFYNIELPEFTKQDGAPGKDVGEWFAAGHTSEELEILKKAARPFDIAGCTSIDDALAECEVELEERGTLEPEFKTPWPNTVTAKLGGANRGDLIIVLAPPKVGKTTFCLNWLDYFVAVEEKDSLLYCLEMKPRKLARKWASYVTKTDDTPFKSKMTKESYAEARRIAQSRKADLLFGYNQVTKEEEVFQTIRNAVRRYGVSVVCFDNLQLLANTTLGKANLGNRTHYISTLTGKFKRLADELNILMILISQPKRTDDEVIPDSRSSEGSSSAEKDCDGMVCLFRKRDAKIKASDIEEMGQFETHENFLPKMWVRMDNTRLAPGGVCTLYMEGAMSWIREYTSAELAESAKPIPVSGAGMITVSSQEVEQI